MKKKLIKRFLEWNDGGPSYNDLHPGPAVATRPPEPVPATRQLRAQLERVTLAYNDRERVLVKELAEREAELADIRNARCAATSALMELEVGELAEVTVEQMLTGEEWGRHAKQWPVTDEEEAKRDAELVAKHGPLEFIGKYPATKGGFSVEQIELSSGMGLDHIGHFYSVYRTRSPLQEDDASYRPRVLAAKEAYDGQ